MVEKVVVLRSQIISNFSRKGIGKRKVDYFIVYGMCYKTEWIVETDILHTIFTWEKLSKLSLNVYCSKIKNQIKSNQMLF